MLSICGYEDRPSCAVGVELLVASAARHLPGVSIDLTCPQMAGRLLAWADRCGLRHLRVRDAKTWPEAGWDVKPAKLLEVLDDGAAEAVRIDSDIVVTGDFRKAIRDVPDEAIVVGQEFRAPQTDGGRLRAAGHGLQYRRPLRYAVNSGVIRVTQRHRKLLQDWRLLLAGDGYRQAQARPVSQRPAAMVSDQDSLWALLCSSGYEGVPVRFLRCGRDIIQNSGANGYHVFERLRNIIGGMPPLVHALGREKPWHYSSVPSPISNPRDYLELMTLELSPYTAAAIPYRGLLSEPAPWLRVRTLPAKALRLLTLGHPAVQGLPLAVAAYVAAGLGRRPGGERSGATGPAGE